LKQNKPDQWEYELTNIWCALTGHDRAVWLRLARRLHASYRRQPIDFAMRVVVFTFILLPYLPTHPMSMVIALGSGLSISLLITIFNNLIQNSI
jgi:hypothetical protein